MHLVLARVGKSRSRLGINVRSSVGYNMYSLFENNVVSHVLSTPGFIIDMTYWLTYMVHFTPHARAENYTFRLTLLFNFAPNIGTS